MGCCTFVLLLMVAKCYGTWTLNPPSQLSSAGPNFGRPEMQSEEMKAGKISSKGPRCPKNEDGNQTDKKRKRILGGHTYNPRNRDDNEPDWEHWTASLIILRPENGKWVPINCGGALITKKHVLTALHCLKHFNKPDVLDPKYVGMFFDVVNAKLHKGTRFSAKKFFYVNMHDGKGKVRYYNNTKIVKDDIAVIEMEREIVDKDCLQPIKITNEPLEKPFQAVGIQDLYWTAGWGVYTLAPGKKREPEDLQYINRQPNIPCPDDQTIDLDKNICFNRTNQYGTCIGDSGSPGVIKLNDEWYLQGIHRSGKKAAGYKTGNCYEPRSIGVDINVFKYKAHITRWIKPYKLGV